MNAAPDEENGGIESFTGVAAAGVGACLSKGRDRARQDWDVVPKGYREGIEAARRGDDRAAVDAFAKARQLSPSFLPAAVNLGAALGRLGRIAEAVEVLEGSVRKGCRDRRAVINLAVGFEALGRYPQAVDAAQLGLEIDPESQTALQLVAKHGVQAGAADAALNAASQLCTLEPNLDSHRLLIRVLTATGRHADAETLAELCVQQASDQRGDTGSETGEAERLHEANLVLAEAIWARVRALSPMGPDLPLLRRRLGELRSLLHRIMSSAPSAEAAFLLGQVLRVEEMSERAEEAIREAVRLSPQHVGALELLGDILIERGATDEAVEALDTVMGIAPLRSRTLMMRVRTRAEKEFWPRAESLARSILDDEASGPSERIDALFVLGQLADRSGDYDQAIQHYLWAGERKLELQRQKSGGSLPPADAKVHERHLRETMETFTRDFYKTRSAIARRAALPIFVVGVPRSGTTLTEQILASHPNVIGAGELPDFTSFSYRCERFVGRRESYPSCVSDVPHELLEVFANEYLEQLDTIIQTQEPAGRQGHPSVRVVDKMPGNIVHVGLIHTLFPDAPIIRIRRDPRDVAVSALKNHLDFPFCDIRRTAHFAVACDRLAEWWSGRLPGRIFELEYEDLVSDLESNVRRLLAYCGLSWDEQCLRYHQNDRVIRTPSRWQVRQPAYRSSIGAWRKYSKHLSELDAILGQPPAQSS